ncbi:MAG: GvpL/GvpF family gas vesicle protein [Labilithrix sp.]|nr:GvpL/GvpF family gas vesicle protein [Labilithrix sp.]
MGASKRAAAKGKARRAKAAPAKATKVAPKATKAAPAKGTKAAPKATKATKVAPAKAAKVAPAKAALAKAAKVAPAKAAPAPPKSAKRAKASAPAGARAAAESGRRSAAKRGRRDTPPPRVQRLPPSAPEARDAISPVAVRALPPEPVALEGTRGKYVYCVIHADRALNFGPLGIGAEPAEVHTVNFKDIAAVVSDTPIAVHEPTRANVLTHERVNETVMRDHTVIPMSFGTVFKTRDDIHELLRSAYEAFKDVLVKMEDKLEFGLKVLWDRDVIVRELETENEDIRRLKSEITSQKGSTYFARMQYGRLVDGALQARSERYVQEIFDALRPASVASRANRPIGDRMIMNAAFLVRRDKEADFDRIVKQIGANHAQLTFKYTGPWPPYNFVNIRLKLERA